MKSGERVGGAKSLTSLQLSNGWLADPLARLPETTVSRATDSPPSRGWCGRSR